MCWQYIRMDIYWQYKLFKRIKTGGEIMSYPFLIGEMAKRRITREALSKSLGLHRNAISYKLREGSFSIEEAAKVKEEFFPDIPITTLFAKEEKTNICSND